MYETVLRKMFLDCIDPVTLMIWISLDPQKSKIQATTLNITFYVKPIKQNKVLNGTSVAEYCQIWERCVERSGNC